jgi:hypothetical protein
MRRFDLLDEFTMVAVPMRHRDPPHAGKEKQTEDIRMDMATWWPPLIGMLGLLGLKPGRSFLACDRWARREPEAHSVDLADLA